MNSKSKLKQSCTLMPRNMPCGRSGVTMCCTLRSVPPLVIMTNVIITYRVVASLGWFVSNCTVIRQYPGESCEWSLWQSIGKLVVHVNREHWALRQYRRPAWFVRGTLTNHCLSPQRWTCSCINTNSPPNTSAYWKTSWALMLLMLLRKSWCAMMWVSTQPDD